MPTRDWLLRGGIVAAAALGLAYVLTLPPPPHDHESSPKPVPASADDVDKLLQAAKTQAHDRLGFTDPELVQVLFGCVSPDGAVSTASAACEGSMIATLRDAARADRYALAAAGKNGMMVSPAMPEMVLPLPAAKCTPAKVLAVARGRGLSWTPDKQIFLAYGPASGGGAEWSVTKDKAAWLALSDSDCLAARP